MFSEPSSTITEGVRVEVGTAWLKDRSVPERNLYVFAYQVRIFNESAHQIQLLRRKWVITDAFGHVRVVEGDGVIGEQPVLSPGDHHEYISGVDFPTSVGHMTGWYYMVRNDGAELQVRIPEFVMTVPHLLN